ncbi:DUF1499 domain-containing protein [Jeotgalibacillus campisalis]|uniref:DUF1499 domain-containing protein n=1 Tax=Jeotgalibacillus campisalis TaxID=220754 RepID=A0A0C2VG47_9BACL|nr:DUF1499 domain-containing protein [Jeotgalibacillus campisalis]KIL47862.1 hypothetical protein KR50_20290 [Jeotgalibacillus campisalis]
MSKKNRIRNGKLLPMSQKKNDVSTQTDQAEKKMDPLPFKENIAESHDKIKSILSSWKRVEIKTDETDYIHAVVSSRIFKFKDDVEFLFDDQTNLVHFRSASRSGMYDFGVNRKRMKEVSDQYREEK